MTGTKTERKSVREAAVELTRDRIVEAAQEAFDAQWYDDVTLRGVAAAAGVALQTVVNHFGTKEALFAAAAERTTNSIAEARWTVARGDVDGGIAALIADYERTGDGIIRTLASEEKVSVVRPVLATGRQGHEAWVAHVCSGALTGLKGAARRCRLTQLVVVTDVYAWKVMRRDKGLSVEQTAQAMRELVLALHNQREEAK